MSFEIYSLDTPHGGKIAIGPMLGRFSPLGDDIAKISTWQAGLVVSAVEDFELPQTQIQDQLMMVGISWRHFPIKDFDVPAPAQNWPALSTACHTLLRGGGRIFFHCYGGQGRSGTLALRLLIEMEEEPEKALSRLRAVRPEAVETDAQYAWACEGAAV
ncbi:MAG: protein-tyrosine phosphatase family protein [Halocynthiibacter sp.]